MFRRPPALADWILNFFGCTRQNDALAGDLLEEFRNGRSAGWYWRQTLAVILNGFSRHVASLAPYLLAICGGYALQFWVSYELWSLALPHAVTGSAWLKVGVYAFLQVAAYLAILFPVKWTLGERTVRLCPLFRAAGNDRQKRAAILALASYDSFSCGLWSYCICALVFWRFSQAEFLKYQSIWFVLWVLAPAVLSRRGGLHDRPRYATVPATGASEPVEDREPWLAIAQREPIITVALPNGRAILLERDRLAESIFAAGDPDLIRVAFGSGRSLDLLRRAVWLGGYRSHSHIEGRAETLTLAELATLIQETSRTRSVIEAWYPNRPVNLSRRIRLWFWGDSV